jgi:putative ABC transport system permease protein
MRRAFDDFRQDVAYALRSFARNRAFTCVAALTLALGIGANTAIFSVINSVLLRPLPYKDADRLVRVVENIPASETPNGRLRRVNGLRAAELDELAKRSKTLDAIGGWATSLITVRRLDETIRLQGVVVSPELFALLGAEPVVGQVTGSTPGRDDVVVLSAGTWARYFGSDPGVVGQTLRLTNRLAGPEAGELPITVIGVMSERFRFPDAQTEFWRPVRFTSTMTPPVVAHLANGISTAAAASEIATILLGLRNKADALASVQTSDPPRFEVMGLQEQVVGPARPALKVLFVAVGFVLLIACVNVANLLLARTAARQREIAIRGALGAGRSRMIRQLLTESLMLAAIGGAVGTLFTLGGLQLFRVLGTSIPRADLGSTPIFPRIEEIQIDAAALVYAVAITITTALLFGLAPALRHSRRDPMDALRSTTVIGVSNRTRGALVIAEVGLAMMLLVSGGLLIRSFIQLSNVHLGYEPAGVLTFQVAVPENQYPPDRMKAFADELANQLRSVPSVGAAGYARQLPMVRLEDSFPFRRTSALPPQPPALRNPDTRFVSDGYLETMGIAIVAGRGLTSQGVTRPREILINQTLARRDFGNEDPVDRQVFVGRDNNPWMIVGVVEDVRQFDLDAELQPQIFAHVANWPGPNLFPVGPYYVARLTTDDPAPVVERLRHIVRDLEPEGALFNVLPMADIVSNSIGRPRMYAVLLGSFAALAVALSSIGIYGVLAYTVSQRTREIGIRMALGASRRHVITLVVGRAIVLVGAGLGLGIAGAAATSRWLQSMLFGLTARDPVTFVSVSIVFIVVAALASLLPAQRAARVDPVVALRVE